MFKSSGQVEAKYTFERICDRKGNTAEEKFLQVGAICLPLIRRNAGLERILHKSPSNPPDIPQYNKTTNKHSKVRLDYIPPPLPPNPIPVISLRLKDSTALVSATELFTSTRGPFLFADGLIASCDRCRCAEPGR